MADPKTVHATVIYKPNQTPNVEIQEWVLPKSNRGDLIFKNDGFPGFWVEFHLDPVSCKDYYFPNDENLALFVAVIHDENDACPTSGTWDEFVPKKVKDSNKTLVVRNHNRKLPSGKKEVRFGYTLRVARNVNEQTEFLELDPGGVNQNGQTKSWSSAALLLSGAAIGSLLTLGTEALLRTS